jgi:hypothetical protein
LHNGQPLPEDGAQLKNHSTLRARTTMVRQLAGTELSEKFMLTDFSMTHDSALSYGTPSVNV